MKKNLNVILVSLLFSIILWISISLSNDFYTTFKVPLKVTNFPSGYTTGSNLPDDISVKIKGEGWKLVSINIGSKSYYVVSAGNDSGKKTVNLNNYLSENQWLSSDIEVIDIYPDTLSFYIEKVYRKKAKIIPQLNLNFKPGYGLASPILISPESTIVLGPATKIINLESVSTEEVELNNLDSKVIKKANLGNLPGMSYENNSITITLNVQKIVDKNYNDIPVEVLDLPKDRDVVLLPNKINVGLRGGIELLGKINDKDIKVYVYYRDVVLDTLGSIIPKVEFPENVALLFTKPEKLRYVIKKF